MSVHACAFASFSPRGRSSREHRCLRLKRPQRERYGVRSAISSSFRSQSKSENGPGPLLRSTLCRAQKTATAVAHCKRGRGLLRINGVPLEHVEPQTLRFKVKDASLDDFLDLSSDKGRRTHSSSGKRAFCGRRYTRSSSRRRSHVANIRYSAHKEKNVNIIPNIFSVSAIRQAISKSLVAYYQKCE